LILIGAGLIIGLFSRVASLAGMVLLAFYTMSHPAIIGANYVVPTEGNYLWINKNLIELFALWVLALFPTSVIIGVDRFLFNKI
jgi:thiosulfate dehydrogenase [quinone] large subunit